MKSLRYIWVIALIIFYGCNSPTLDISKIDFNGSVAKQIGGCSSIERKKIRDDSQDSITISKYYETDKISPNNLTYAEIPVDSTFGLLTHTYNNKFIEFIFSAERTKTLKFAEVLLKKLGNPNKVLIKTEYIKDSLVYNSFKTQFPAHTNWVKDSIPKLSYPNMFIWDKPNFVHCYLVEINFPNKTQNTYVVRSKEAYRNGVFEVVYGKYLKGLKDSPIHDYLKE